VEEIRISIALCTYNGDPYLSELLESLAGQDFRPYELVVCDDGSTDSTLSILNEFEHVAPFPLRIFSNTENLGVIKNFEKALSLCTGDYIAPCDQDDIWQPEKLERLADCLHACGSGDCDGPVLVHSSLELVDSKLESTGKSYMKHQGLEPQHKNQYRTLLVQNYIPGCSMLFSADLLTQALPFPDSTVMHDWWLALIASLAGTICFEPSRTVLYRQHKGNLVGSASRFSPKTFLYMMALWPALKTIRRNYMAASAQAIAACNRLSENSINIPVDAANYTESLSMSRFSTLASLARGRIGRANILRNLTLLVAVLISSRKEPVAKKP
jgi:glycosyltransferase involved in cell wall biosynthesis